jgi:hypothetical protein
VCAQEKVAFIDRLLREANLEHRARFVPAVDATVDDSIDIIEIEGGSAISIQFSGGHYAVNVYDRDDDGEVEASNDHGVFSSLDAAARKVVWLLKTEGRR